MILDTLVIVLICIPQQQYKPKENRFTETFQKADKEFNQRYKLEIKELQKASKEAVKEADIETSKQRQKALKTFCDFDSILKTFRKP